MKSTNLIPIPEKDLKRFEEPAARAVMQTVKWTPGRRNRLAKKEYSPDEEREVVTDTTPRAMSVILGNAALKIGQDEGLFNLDGLALLHALRRGITIGMYVSEQFQKGVGYDHLLVQKNQERLPADRISEFQQKGQTAAAIQTFVAASYALWKLASYKKEEVAAVPMEMSETPEVSLLSPPDSLQCLVFYMERLLSAKSTSGQRIVQNGPGAIKMAQLYLQSVIDEIKLKAGALPFVDAFTKVSYKSETEDFTVQGFEIDLNGGSVVSATVSPVKFSDIVGNRTAKHASLRAIQRIALFDTKLCKSPYYAAFGEVPRVRMGKGMAGTGKTMQAAANFTLLQEIGENLGFVPIFHELPKDIASEFQGKTSKNMVTYMSRFADKSRIIYGLMDDAEGVLKSIEGSHSAESTEGAISVFLTFTEGAGVSKEPSWLLDVLTNLPEKIYQPVMSRIQEKFDIDGAITVDDFLDQDWLWRQRIKQQEDRADIPKGERFDDMIDPPKYAYMGTQGQLVNMAEVYKHEPVEPRQGELKKIFEEVRKLHREDEHRFYAEIFFRVKQAFPKNFSSRDVRNIQVAINNRRVDFDLDPDWLRKRASFVDKPFDERVKMLLNHQREALRGLSLKTVRLQETVRYLNVLLSIPENARQREIMERRDQLVKDMIAQARAVGFIREAGGVEKLAAS